MFRRRIPLYLLTTALLLSGCNQDSTDEEKVDSKVTESPPTEEVEEVKEETTDVEKDVSEDSESEGNDETDSDSTKENPLGDYEIFLGGEMTEADDKIIIKGESNLLPGARLSGEVRVGNDEFIADTTELVKDDGTYYMEIPYENLNKETTVHIKFHFDHPQDNAIKRHYGERGQNLKGPFIYKHKKANGGRSPQDIFQMAMATVTFEPGEEMAVRQFSEPSWYPLPEDYGDPRVWLEVLEITNDKEYYYLHGKSNILEGSKIKGKFHWKSGETSINPDGSFDLKIEYEYRENTPFIIEFRPNDFQWNTIEEAYGKKGTKLVGDLVVTNSSGTVQYIEKVIEHQSTEINVPDNVELNIEGTEATMTLPDNVLFDFDKYQLKEDSKAILTEISKTLANFNREIEVVINGHTDNNGDEKYNLELSKKRAEEVKAFLIKQQNMEKVNFTTNGYGETKPVATNDTKSGQAKNRRVEIIINLK